MRFMDQQLMASEREFPKSIITGLFAITKDAMLPKVEVFECNCFQCGHGWFIRVPTPKERRDALLAGRDSLPEQCPKCQNENWNVRKE